MKKEKPTLYIKPTCPWCQEAVEFFSGEGVEFNAIDITESDKARKELESVSKQSKVPTFIYKDFMVADFDVGEFLELLEDRQDIKEDLNLTDV